LKAGIDSLEGVYDKCCADGFIAPKEESNAEKSSSLLTSAMNGLERIRIVGEAYELKSGNYSFLLRDYYEALRMLIDGLLRFDGVAISNHQCSNAFLCVKHPELEFDWELLESMRILRNSVNYQGKLVSREQWMRLKMPFEVYISTLKKTIGKKLG
jgi:hypothetical protein